MLIEVVARSFSGGVATVSRVCS